MIESPFAQVGPALFDRGYSPIPIMPNNKMPGIVINDEWRLFKGWNEFCTARPSKFQVSQWAKFPNAGVGVALGQGLICIDIDQEEIVAPLLAILPPSPVQKKGRKGLSAFYRGNTDKIRSRNYRTPEKVGLVDLLSEGKQTVLPPSIHPDTGEPYYWWTDDTLQDLSLDDLPELPDNIAEKIGEVLKAFGYDPDRDRQDAPAPSSDVDLSISNTRSFFRTLNENALNNIAAWAPKLALPKGHWQGAKYRAVAPWRTSGSGRAVGRRNTNLSIAPGGIEDFGTGETFTALNVVMKVMELSDSEMDAAVQWLGECLGYDFGVSINLVNGPKTQNRLESEARAERGETVVYESTPTDKSPPEKSEWQEANPPVGVPVKRNNLAGAFSATPATPATINSTVPAEDGGAVVEETDITAPQDVPAPTMAELEALCNPPGLVGELIDWICASSTSPSRPAALGAALTWVGTLAGRHHAGPTDLRTNLYVVTLAPSGYGKDYARKCIIDLAADAGLHRFLGPEGFLSDSAMRKSLEAKPCFLSVMDEFGGFIGKIMDRRAGTHQTGMRQMLMKLFTSSNSTYGGDASAAEGAAPISNPNMSVYGTTTQHDFWPNMSGRGVADGFLPRWLILTITGEAAVDVTPTMPKEAPDRIKEWCRAIVTLPRKGGNLPDNSAQRVVPLVAEWGEGAEQTFRYYRDLFKQRGRECHEDLKSLWTRSMEIALRVAHIVAIGVNPERPVLTAELMTWASTLTELSTRAAISEVRDRLASTDKQAEYLKVRRMIKDVGTTGIAPKQLKKQVNGEFDGLRFDNIIKQLSDAGEIEFREYTSAKGGRPSWRYFIS